MVLARRTCTRGSNTRGTTERVCFGKKQKRQLLGQAEKRTRLNRMVFDSEGEVASSRRWLGEAASSNLWGRSESLPWRWFGSCSRFPSASGFSRSCTNWWRDHLTLVAASFGFLTIRGVLLRHCGRERRGHGAEACQIRVHRAGRSKHTETFHDGDIPGVRSVGKSLNLAELFHKGCQFRVVNMTDAGEKMMLDLILQP